MTNIVANAVEKVKNMKIQVVTSNGQVSFCGLEFERKVLSDLGFGFEDSGSGFLGIIWGTLITFLLVYLQLKPQFEGTRARFLGYVPKVHL